MLDHLTTYQKLLLLVKLKGSGGGGTLKTLTGNLPLTVSDALNHALASLTRYGLCTQDGTPTPDAPVDIMTNNGAIKLRRPSGMPIAYQMVEWLKPAGSIVITGFKTKSTQEITTVFYREIRGSSYLYASDTATSGTTNTTAYLTTAGGNWRWDSKVATINPTTGIEITSVQNKDGVWINGWRYGAYTEPGDFVSTSDLKLSSYENTTVRIYSMTIRDGETVTLDLVPVQRVTDNAYGFYDKVSGNFYTNADATFDAGDPIPDPVEIYTDGTDEVLTVSGKNIFDKSNLTRIKAYIASTGTRWTGAAAGYSVRIPCRPNTTYTARYNGSGPQTVLSFGSTDNDDVPQGNGYITITQAIRNPNPTIGNPIALTTSATDKWLIVSYNAADPENTDMADNLQIEEGSTATDYEPYVAPQTVSVPMLLGVGDYKDAAELINGIKTGKVGVKVFDGSESFTVSSSGAMITAIGDVAIGADNIPMNTHFALETSPTSIAVGTQRFGASAGKIYSANYYMKHPTITTVSAFKAWLATEYAAGTPVIVVYPLATETTEQTTPQHLVTHKGTNVVDSTANVSPVEVELQYYGTASASLLGDTQNSQQDTEGA